MSSFVPPPRAKDGGIEAPMSLGGLFADSDSDDEEERGEGGGFDQEYSEQTVQLCEVSLIIRQYCWHMANANKGRQRHCPQISLLWASSSTSTSGSSSNCSSRVVLVICSITSALISVTCNALSRHLI